MGRAEGRADLELSAQPRSCLKRVPQEYTNISIMSQHHDTIKYYHQKGATISGNNQKAEGRARWGPACPCRSPELPPLGTYHTSKPSALCNR
jgi:hypothetical protein